MLQILTNVRTDLALTAHAWLMLTHILVNVILDLLGRTAAKVFSKYDKIIYKYDERERKKFFCCDYIIRCTALTIQTPKQIMLRP